MLSIDCWHTEVALSYLPKLISRSVQEESGSGYGDEILWTAQRNKCKKEKSETMTRSQPCPADKRVIVCIESLVML
jgi:hypothetical protein